MTDKSRTSVVEHSQLILGNSPKVPSWRREREKGTSTTKILKRGEKTCLFSNQTNFKGTFVIRWLCIANWKKKR